MEPYQGAGTVRIQPLLGMGGFVVLDLLRELPAVNYHVYTDNFFTSLRHLEELRIKGMQEEHYRYAANVHTTTCLRSALPHSTTPKLGS